MADTAVSHDLVMALERADRRAEIDGYRLASVGHIVAEIIDQPATFQVNDSSDLQGMVTLEDLRAEADGLSVGYVAAQKGRVMESACRFANSASVTTPILPGHYLVAALMSVGDHLQGLPQSRHVLARVAQQEFTGATWLAQGSIAKSALAADMRRRTGGQIGRSRPLRWAWTGYGVTRSWIVQRRIALMVIAFLPGLLVREAIWAVLALFHRCSRRPFSPLGVGDASGLTKVVAPRTRLRMECVVSVLCLLLGVTALAAWVVPQTLLGTFSGIAIGGGSEQELVATSIVAGGGVLHLGPWIPWSLLAVSIPPWESLLRMEWTARYEAGGVTRGYLAVLKAIGGIGRPIDAALSTLGFPAILGRAFVIVLPATLAMRLLA